MKTVELDGRTLSLNDIVAVAVDGAKVGIAASAYPRMLASRRVVEDVIARGETAYGINTGFGKLSDVRIAPDELEALQRNLVRSHSCG
ncbi:MAG TPA: aromatic amino acid lyase, partial [Acidobacteriaceae bacterium]|nr:aromatic amino acid lyase [Acidobacteriaceae bacterium]